MTKKSPFYHVFINWDANFSCKKWKFTGGDCGVELCERVMKWREEIGGLASSVD